MTEELHTAPTENPNPLPQFAWVKLLGFGLGAIVLVGVLSLYLQPAFLVTLATQVWACF
ncbi:MAG: hypothetical protein WCK66_08190 [Betaproteobacteria bacterium]|jgi:hypothetical protein